MRRPATWVAVGVVLLVGVAAAADAVRQKAAEPEVIPTTRAPPDTTTQGSPATGLSGVLYYTDESCELRGFQLPDLRRVDAPAWDSCEFSLSPDARQVWVAGTTWGRGVRAVESRGIVVTFDSGEGFSFQGSSPAFRRDDVLMFARDDSVRALIPNCLPVADPRVFVGRTAVDRCSRVFVSDEAVRRAALQHPNAPDDPTYPFTVSIRETAWLDGDRLVALLTMHVRGIGEDFDLLALFEGGGIVETIAVFESLRGLRASPSGSYFGVLTEGRASVLLFDRETRALPLPPISGVRAFEWSPDEDWIALATPRDVYVDLTERRQFTDPPRLRQLDIVAQDLAWRAVFVS